MITVAPEVFPDGMPLEAVIRSLRSVHDRLWANWRFLKEQRIHEGNRITGITTSAGVPLEVAHKLRRVPLGYWVTRSVGVSPIAVTEAGAGPTDTLLTLTPSAAGTIDLYVF